MQFSIVVAMDKKMGIGKDNRLPWPRLKGDMKHFHDVTTTAADGKTNAVIMGRKTWESLPDKSRPLKGRVNVVLSRQDLDLPEGILHAGSFEAALKILEGRKDIDNVWVIGGANVYRQALEMPELHRLYVTEILDTFECDAFFPEFDSEDFYPIDMSKTYEENGIQYRFLIIEYVD